MARAKEFIPSTPAELDAEWVTGALRTAGVLGADVSVTALAAGPLDEAGEAMTGDLVRVALTYDRPTEAPPTLIAKFATADRQTRGMLEQFDAYGREINFYRGLAERVVCRTPRHLGSALDPGKAKEPSPRVARIIDALPDRVQLLLTKDVERYMRPTKRRYALLIEDMGGDTTVYNAANPPPIDHLTTVLTALAAMHAQFWGDDDLAGHPALGHLVTRTPGLYQTEVRNRSMALARERWSDWWTSEHTELLSEATDHLPADIESINQGVTLVHGDPRSDNLLFLSADSVAIVDWALSCFAPPGWDVSYLLSSSVEPADVDSIEGLVAGYHDQLSSHGVDLSVADLDSVIDAGFRTQAVQEALSVRVMSTAYGDAGALHDLWMPRILAALSHRRGR